MFIRQRCSVHFVSFLFVVPCSTAYADESSDISAYYLANSGVMIEHGETRIVFNPLYRKVLPTILV